jgi:hypothetical protein
MTLKHILLELARTKERPDGDPQCGYEFAAPLDAAGHFDAAQWQAERLGCTVRRFWRGAEDERGLLVHKGGPFPMRLATPTTNRSSSSTGIRLRPANT